MRSIHLLSATFLLAVLIKPALGQTLVQPPSDSLKTYALQGMVITASKYYQSEDQVTQKMDVIRNGQMRSMILEKRNIAEALTYSPGSSVTVLSRNDANWGTYGGIGSKYSTFMLNGLPIDAFMDPQNLEIMAVERIEVQRGPASVLYSNYLSQDFAGAQSPLCGTVNLIPKYTVSEKMTALSSGYGQYHTSRQQLYHQNQSGNLHYLLGLSYEQSNYTDYGTSNSWLNMIDHPEYKKTKLYGSASYYLNESHTQRISVLGNKTFHDGDAGRPYRGYDHSYDLLNVEYQWIVNASLLAELKAGWRRYDRAWQESKYPDMNNMDSLLSNNGVRQNILPFDLTLVYRHLENSLLTFGIDYQSADYQTYSDPLVGYNTYGNKSSAYQNGVYAQEEWITDKFSLRGGLRYNYTRYQIDLISGARPGNSKQSWDRLLWSTGGKYKINASFNVFANAGTSFMTPGLKSTGGTIRLADQGQPGKNGQLPNPDLKPESGLGMDAGLNFKLQNKMTLSARIFQNSVDDAIVENIVSQNPSQTQSVNAGETKVLGLEMTLRHEINDRLDWFANYTHLKSTISNKLDPDQDGNRIPFAPGHIANAGFAWTLPMDLHVSPMMHYNGKIYDSSSRSSRQSFKGYWLLNLTAEKNFKLDGSVVGLSVQLYNIANRKFEMPWQFQDPGFSMSVGLNVQIR